jgi:hypothetical protein
VSFIPLPKQVRSFKAQDTARATPHTFTAGKAMGIDDGLSQPGMPADIDADRAIKSTDATLNAARGFWDNLPGSQGFPALGFGS